MKPQVDLWIDPICPWCLIGVTQLERAAASIGVVPTINFRAFRLHPAWPSEGKAWRDFQTYRNLPDAVFDRVAKAGAHEGIAFDFGRVARVPDTAPLHQILIAAAEAGLAREVCRAFTDSYFFGGENLANPDVVLTAALRGGLSQLAVSTALSDPAVERRMLADEADARSIGLSGVPFGRIGNLSMSGAQGVAGYAEALAAALTPLPAA